MAIVKKKPTTKKASPKKKSVSSKSSFSGGAGIGKGKNLLIVESPTEKTTVSKWLDSTEFMVEATIGHFKKDSDKCLDIDMETYLPKLKNDPYKANNIARIAKQIEAVRAKGGKIYIQTDDDREGEGIAWSVWKEFKLKKGEYCRVIVNALEQKQYLEAIKNPRPDLNWDVVESWFARSALDKFIGYGVSPVLWEFSNGMHGMGLSAGRVQSSALNMLAMLEEKIKAFRGGTLYSLRCKYEGGFVGDMVGDYLTKEEASEIYWEIKNENQALVDEYKEGKSTRSPKEPFRTSTIQQACSSNLSISPDETMKELQSGFQSGKNTYMRTDSVTLPSEYLEKLGEYIKEKYGEKYYQLRDWQNKKDSQAGHTGIYPVHIERDYPLDGYGEIYDILKRRTVASQMIPAIYSTQSLQTDIGGYKFVSKGRRLIEKGFLTVYDVEEDKEDDSDSQSNIPRELKDGEKLKIIGFSAEKHELRPPVRLTAAALIARLEDLGIGRPSTFASIIKTLIDKDYVSVEGTKQTITVTERGLYVANLLRVLAPDIVDLKFTADMENKLDMISSGKSKRMDVIKPLIQDVVFKSMTKAGIGFDSKGEKVKTGPVRISPSEKETMDKLGTIDKEPKACPNCGSDKYKFHEGWQYGPYFKCSECGLTHNVTERILDSKCPHCGKPMIRKKSKKGDIYFTCVDKEGCGHFTSVEPGTE